MKVGAQLMLTTNIDIDTWLVNWSRGVVLKYESGMLSVKFLNGMNIDFSRYTYSIPLENIIF